MEILETDQGPLDKYKNEGEVFIAQDSAYRQNSVGSSGWRRDRDSPSLGVLCGDRKLPTAAPAHCKC